MNKERKDRMEQKENKDNELILEQSMIMILSKNDQDRENDHLITNELNKVRKQNQKTSPKPKNFGIY